MGFDRRGIVLIPSDFSLAEWPELARDAGLSVIGLHPTPEEVVRFVRTTEGRRTIERMVRLGLDVEYELHAMSYLLPRDLFPDRPTLFRRNEHGSRTPDSNLCPSSPDALAIVGERAAGLARTLRPTTGRYFLWPDDAGPWCLCRKCAGLSPSDQAMIVTNEVLRAIRTVDARATVAFLAYANTSAPPAEVRPDDGVFLEWAPIERDSGRALSDPASEQNRAKLAELDELLAVFAARDAQVLDYWMDCSRFSGWKRPAVRIPYNDDVLRADLAAFAERGIPSITSFGCWLDRDYVARHGMFPLADYGLALSDDYPTPPQRQ